ncbi:MAG: acyl-CoA dehydrogenase family protein [Candidatus Yanofskybacteria bacterium]|nr:acyl-CoA dehydrogenase family protein [Candidatus Yanofskybacteria bacterium]
MNKVLQRSIYREDLLHIANEVREFSLQEVQPHINLKNESEKKKIFMENIVAAMAKCGYLGALIPEDYGGMGYTLTEFLPVIEGIAAFSGSLALTLAGHNLAVSHILQAGSEEQKQKYLPRLASGELGAWCLTEPGAGSNAFGGMKSMLEQTEAELWKLDALKTFITNGCHAGIYVVTARGKNNSNQLGISACIVEKEKHCQNIKARPLGKKMGMNESDTAEIIFDGLNVEIKDLLGYPGQAQESIKAVLRRGRLAIAGFALGLARDSLERAIAYTPIRMVSGGSLFNKQLTQAKLAKMDCQLWIAWQATLAAARLADENLPFENEASKAKLTASEIAIDVCHEAIQLVGGTGYMEESKVEGNFRDARLLTIGEGTSEILLLSIAKKL